MNTRPVSLRGGLASAALAITLSAQPQPAGAQIPVGDPVRGKQLAVECFACHGADGNSPSPINPRIGGEHEYYLFMALKGYLDGTRADSLMRGAVLNKSEQDLRDMAAYYAAQSGDLVADSNDGPPAAPAAGVMRFDHGGRTAAFTSMVARAEWLAARARAVETTLCDGLDGSNDPGVDGDGDGVADARDAEPADPAEFAADRNQDGFFEVCNVEQLVAIAEGDFRERSYQLVRDLDAAEVDDFAPIGDCGPSGNCMQALGVFGFAGVFDGQGYTVRNLTIRRPEAGGVGLFGVLAEAGVIMNLHLADVKVSGRAGTGALVGSNFGVVANSSAAGEVSGALAIGGLVGGSGGLVYGSRFAGQVSGQQAVGGLVGDMTGAVYYGEAAASVRGERGVGGLVGLNTFGVILGSSASGAVAGSNDLGGLVGVNTDARVSQSFATGAVGADGNNVGGLVGFNSLSSVRNSYALGSVSGADGVGGLAGRNNGAIENSFAAGAVRGAGLIGGIVGVVVEGRQSGTHTRADHPTPYGGTQSDLETLTGENTGWAPAQPPVADLLNYFCDENRNGFVDPAERRKENYVWRFKSGHLPSLRCAVGT